MAAGVARASSQAMDVHRRDRRGRAALRCGTPARGLRRRQAARPGGDRPHRAAQCAIGGVVFGTVFWWRGLEHAMLAHFSADLVLHVVAPLALAALA